MNLSNQRPCKEAMACAEAIEEAAISRLRPIVLTSPHLNGGFFCPWFSPRVPGAAQAG